MALGAITFTTVSWTVGDVVTEAKLDNMHANEQAYDAHAAQGILLNNDVGFYQKNSSGTNKKALNINSSDNLEIGENGQTISFAGSSNLINEVLVSGDTATDKAKALITEDFADDKYILFKKQDGALLDSNTVLASTLVVSLSGGSSTELIEYDVSNLFSQGQVVRGIISVVDTSGAVRDLVAVLASGGQGVDANGEITFAVRTYDASNIGGGSIRLNFILHL